MFRGLQTVTYGAPNLAAAKAWYTDWLGFGPYFDEPFYVGFAVAGCELGLVPDQPAADGENGPAHYWNVADLAAALSRLESLRAAVVDPPRDVGGGITLARVRDPFGNVLGVIEDASFRPRGDG